LDQNLSSPDLKSKDSGSSEPGMSVELGWQKNWVSNIAIKIMAPLLWGLIFIGLAIAFFVYGDVGETLTEHLNEQADRYVYAISRTIISDKDSLELLGETIVNTRYEGIYFNRVRIQMGKLVWNFGHYEANSESLSRPLIVSMAPSVKTTEVTFYHPPVSELAKKERIRLLFTAGVPLVILGFALAFLIQRIIIRPIQELVIATQKISAGDISLRMNSSRQDEFGHLERFFDEMLDQLQVQKEQLQTARDSAQAADRTKSQFLANMSHELRTPLNAIIGYSELMMEALVEKEEKDIAQLNDLECIRSAGQHLLSLINDILDLAKIEAGKMEISRSPFRISSMIDSVASTAMPMMIRNNIHAEIDCPATIGGMESDELRIRQVLINLLSNAAKFTYDGNVKLLAERYSMNGCDWIRFKVEDDGIGISELHSKRLFDEFAQIEDHVRGKPSGTGLGLAISRKFCNLMGGDIRLESTPGVGSTFIVDLPATLPSQIGAAAKSL